MEEVILLTSSLSSEDAAECLDAACWRDILVVLFLDSFSSHNEKSILNLKPRGNIEIKNQANKIKKLQRLSIWISRYHNNYLDFLVSVPAILAWSRADRKLSCLKTKTN